MWLNVTSPANGGTGMLVHAASGLCLDAGAPASQTSTPVVLNACGSGNDASAPRQVFDLLGGTVQLANPSIDGTVLCLTVGTYSTNSRIQAAPCPPAGASVPLIQQFTLSQGSPGLIVSPMFNGSYAVDWADPSGVDSKGWWGLPVQLAQASASHTWQLLATGSNTGRLQHVASGMCLDVGGVPNNHGCLDPSVRGLPFCDSSLPIPSRVADLLARLTPAEIIGLTGSAPISDTCDTIDTGVPRLDIPPHEWLVEANSMVASSCTDTVCATNFPSALNLASSFNRSVWLAKGQVVSDEMRVLNNLRWHRNDGQTGTMIGLSGFGPDINQPRDPRNGRIGELPAEDPYLIGEYAVQYVTGMQANPLDPPAFAHRLKMSAGVKHYAGYSLETNRFGSKGNFTTFDLWDSYLRPYERAFVEGQAAGSMCAYISLAIDGGPSTPACASEYLLQTIVREYWARPDATHTSDCGAVANMADANHYVKNYTYAAAAAVNAGMDLNSNTILPQNLGTAVQLGLTDMGTITAAVSRTLALRMRLGLLDPLEDQPYTQLGLDHLSTPYAKQLVQEAAGQGVVLVKNRAGVLPLKPGVKLAVVGPLADNAQAIMGDYYADDVCPGNNDRVVRGSKGLGHNFDCVTTVAAALTSANVGGQTVTFPGVQMSSNDTSWAQALAAVSSADVTVLALGTDRSIGEEGTDLTDIGLPGVQGPFAQAVMQAAGGKPVILMILSSFPTAYDYNGLDQAVDAVVLGYAPTFGAPAIAANMFGSTNKWGRAVLTVYPRVYQNAVALGDFSMSPTPVNPGRTYRYYNGSAGQPLVKFGQGMSYSTFSLACTAGFTDPSSEAISVACNVSNVAGPAGDIVLMVYHRVGSDIVGRIGSTHPVPLSTLVAFDRASLAPGATMPMVINSTTLTALTLVDETGATVLYPGLHYLDLWDGGMNNVTIPIQGPFVDRPGCTWEGTTGRWVIKRPPPPPRDLV